MSNIYLHHNFNNFPLFLIFTNAGFQASCQDFCRGQWFASSGALEPPSVLLSTLCLTWASHREFKLGAEVRKGAPHLLFWGRKSRPGGLVLSCEGCELDQSSALPEPLPVKAMCLPLGWLWRLICVKATVQILEKSLSLVLSLILPYSPSICIWRKQSDIGITVETKQSQQSWLCYSLPLSLQLIWNLALHSKVIRQYVEFDLAACSRKV